MTGSIAFQGELGAFSHLAATRVRPDLSPLPCGGFDDAFAAVERGAAECAMIPVENSVAGRVADIHHLLPRSSLFMVAEHFEPVRHQLLGLSGARLEALESAHSHPMALAQCRGVIERLGLRSVVEHDTAGAARLVAERGDPSRGAIASRLAGELYGLTPLATDIQDDPDNTTRFIVFARAPLVVPPDAAGPFVTSLLFRVRNVPAALYKGLGGFATNSVNITKIESYQVGAGFQAAQFYLDVEGRSTDPPLARALEELQFFSASLRIVGTYPAHPARRSRTL